MTFTNVLKSLITIWAVIQAVGPTDAEKVASY